MTLPQSDPVSHAVELRHRLVRYLRHGSAVQWWRSMIEAGHPFDLAPSWRSETAGEQARHLAEAEIDRVASGPVLVVEPEVMAALGPLLDDPTWQAVLNEDLLPAPSGMVCFPSPVFDHRDAPLATFTWGPNHAEASRQPLALNGWIKPDRHTRFGTGVPVPKDAPLVPAFNTPLAYSPHVNWDLTATLATGDPMMMGVRAVTALWYALDAGLVRSRQVPTGKKGPVALVLTLDAGTPASAVRDAIDAAWQVHTATGGHAGQDDAAAATAASGVFAAERDREPIPYRLRQLPKGYRDTAVLVAQIEASATDRWPGVWSALDRTITADLGARSYGGPAGNWVAISVAGTTTTLVEQFGVDPDQARRHAPAVAGMATWRAAGRHVVLLPGDRAIDFGNVEDLASPVAGKANRVPPVPFLLMLSDQMSTTMSLCFTSAEPQGTRFWALSATGERDSIDSLQPEWTNIDGSPGGVGADGLVVQFCLGVDLRIMCEPERLTEVGELLGRRTGPIRWPTVPEAGCLTLWVADQAGIEP